MPTDRTVLGLAVGASETEAFWRSSAAPWRDAGSVRPAGHLRRSRGSAWCSGPGVHRGHLAALQGPLPAQRGQRRAQAACAGGGEVHLPAADAVDRGRRGGARTRCARTRTSPVLPPSCAPPRPTCSPISPSRGSLEVDLLDQRHRAREPPRQGGWRSVPNRFVHPTLHRGAPRPARRVAGPTRHLASDPWLGCCTPRAQRCSPTRTPEPSPPNSPTL
jgi:hypothetical protein